MQKTKLISKDFIRDCRSVRERERREETIYNLPPEEGEQPLLPIADCHALLPREDTYSIEDFILNLQAEQFLYYNDPADLSDELPPPPRGPSIDHLNQHYRQRLADSPPSTRPATAGTRVSFCGEVRAKYFREEEAASAVRESEEYLQVEQEESAGMLEREF